MRDQKNLQAANGCRKPKEVSFAEMMMEKNRDRKQTYLICLFVYLLWMLVIALFLDYQMKDVGDRLGGIVMLAGMFLWIIAFSEQYFKCSFTLLGEREQNIITVIRQFPFSVSDYGKYIRKQLHSWQRVIFCGTLAVSGLGMLIFIRHDFYPVFLWETQDSGQEVFHRILGILLVAGLMAMLPDWILRMKLAAAQKYQMNDDRYFRKPVGTASWTMKQEKKWFLIFLEIFLVIFLSILFLVLEDGIHPVSRDGILFIHTPNLSIFAIMILMECVRNLNHYLLRNPGDTVQYQERNRQKKKIAIQLCAGILVFLLPQFYYETYYEDRMESSHFIQTKSYEWKDVVSYEVYCPVFGQDIQLRLRMKDGSEKKVLWKHTNHSEKYYADYDSDYHYIEKMIEKLEKSGAEGSLKDSVKITRKIDRKNIDEWESWKNIRRMLTRTK